MDQTLVFTYAYKPNYFLPYLIFPALFMEYLPG